MLFQKSQISAVQLRVVRLLVVRLLVVRLRVVRLRVVRLRVVRLLVVRLRHAEGSAKSQDKEKEGGQRCLTSTPPVVRRGP